MTTEKERPTSHPHPVVLSDSAVQRAMERVMLQRLEAQYPDWVAVKWQTLTRDLDLPDVVRRMRPDAVWTTGSGQIVVAEVYARVGALKPGHWRKLATDALKLRTLRDALPDGMLARCILAVPDGLRAQVTGGGWLPFALSGAAEIITLHLEPDEQAKIAEACRLQSLGQARTPILTASWSS